MNAQRLAIDISSIVRWVGPPSGMIRVEHEVARYALAHVPNTIFTIYDSERRGFLRLRAEWVAPLIGYYSILLTPEQGTKRKRVVPRLIPKRRIMFLRLEKRRIKATSRMAKLFYAGIQRMLIIGRRLPYELHTTDGTRLNLIRYEDAVADEAQFKLGDNLLVASSDWWHKNPADIVYMASLARCGVSLTAVCYDILPLMRPDWFGQPAGTGEDIRRFKAYWHGVLPVAHNLIVNSRRVQCDVAEYTEKNGIALDTVHVVPLGSHTSASRSAGENPDSGLDPGHFALFVSTIEPRKNHAMLLRIWQRLLDDGVPQSSSFKLVFVGRRGWNVDAVLAALATPGAFGRTILHFEHLDDDHLDWLYDNCAFCVYPSEYEGFGLPIVEAFARGKAVIASNGGALAEVVGSLSPALDPKNEDLWFQTLRDWIENPQARHVFETIIAQNKAPFDWNEVAGRMVAIANSGHAIQRERV
jgi:glycosyltransferase involved in cell wall biosynthesis